MAQKSRSIFYPESFFTFADGNSIADSTANWGLWRTCATIKIGSSESSKCKSNFEDEVEFKGRL